MVKKQKIKRTVALMSLLLLALILALPAVAAGNDSGLQNTYYSKIPFESFALTNDDSQYWLGVDANTLVFYTSASGVISDEDVLVNGIASSGNGLVENSLEYNFSQSRYSNSTNYYAAANRIGLTGTDIYAVQMRAADFAITVDEWMTLASHVTYTAESIASITWNASFAAWNVDSKTWETFSNTVTISPAIGASYMPSFVDLFATGDSSYAFPGAGVPISSLTVTFNFTAPTTYFRWTMLYGNRTQGAVSVMAAFANANPVIKTEVVTEYITVFDGDFFGWLISGVGAFFDTPIFGPDISLGGILAFVLGVAAFVMFLKILR